MNLKNLNLSKHLKKIYFLIVINVYAMIVIEIFLNKKNKIKGHGCLVSIALDGFVRIVKI
jgi:hypothetical protein